MVSKHTHPFLLPGIVRDPLGEVLRLILKVMAQDN
jgi:hypothetical protein